MRMRKHVLDGNVQNAFGFSRKIEYRSTNGLGGESNVARFINT